jgi:hypothetical protein
VDAEDRMKIIRYIENLTMGPIQVEICVAPDRARLNAQ